MKEFKRTAHHRGQAHSASQRSSAHRLGERAMPRKAKHLRLRETHRMARAKTTSFWRTNNATRSKALTAPRNAPNRKHPNYIFRTNQQCPAKQNIYGPAERTKQQKPKLHLSDERAMPREAKHLRPRNKAKTKTTSFGRTDRAPQSETFTAPQNAPNSKIPNYIFRTNEQCPSKQNTYGFAKRTHAPKQTTQP